MAAERGLTVDMEGYQREMERHREISSAGGEPFQAAVITGLPETDDSAKYADAPIRARVFGWVTADGFVGEGKLAPGTETAVVLERTNFYGESGGQVGDCGVLRADDGSEFAVRRTRLFGHCVLHFGKMEKGSLTRAQTVTAEVDPSRFDTMRNHTATHLLNWALRKVLGGHVEQAGSVVEPERLRFDFTHGQAVTDEQLAQVERLVNQRILADEPVSALVLPLEQARRIPGVRAVFGEKYPDPVRVVCVGTTDPLRQAGEDTPVEFCGGTHLQRTAQAGFFKIVSEESVARGVRRITAVTGRGALEHLQRLDQAARAVAGALRVPVEEAPQRVAALLGEVRQLRKQSAAGALGGLEEALAAAHTVGGVKVIVCELPIESVEQMRSAVDQLRQKAAGPAAVLVGSRQGGKLTLVAGLSEDLVRSASLKATDWVKAAAGAVGGSGGGKATMAQAGGKDPDRLPQALQAAAEWVKTRLAGVGRR
jgi:alanyl-tRNA synthetase